MANNDNKLIVITTKESQQTHKQQRAASKKEQPGRERVHRSMYLERDSYDRLNEAFKTTRHKLYPLEVRKSTFIEVCIAYALNHLSDIEAILGTDAQ